MIESYGTSASSCMWAIVNTQPGTAYEEFSVAIFYSHYYIYKQEG